MPALTQQSAYRHAWRRLAERAIEAATNPREITPGLAQVARGCESWTCPTQDRGECFVCSALGAMLNAFARCSTIAARAALAPMILQWADQVVAILDEADGRAARARHSGSPVSSIRKPYADD
jgi:hypothetical protein